MSCGRKQDVTFAGSWMKGLQRRTKSWKRWASAQEDLQGLNRGLGFSSKSKESPRVLRNVLFTNLGKEGGGWGEDRFKRTINKRIYKWADTKAKHPSLVSPLSYLACRKMTGEWMLSPKCAVFQLAWLTKSDAKSDIRRVQAFLYLNIILHIFLVYAVL